jgi:hypothetical protein
MNLSRGGLVISEVIQVIIRDGGGGAETASHNLYHPLIVHSKVVHIHAIYSIRKDY